MKHTFTIRIESDRRISEETLIAVLAQDLIGVAKDGSGIKVEERHYTVAELKPNRPPKRKK